VSSDYREVQGPLYKARMTAGENSLLTGEENSMGHVRRLGSGNDRIESARLRF
jgi:hypothetical protein